MQTTEITSKNLEWFKEQPLVDSTSKCDILEIIYKNI